MEVTVLGSGTVLHRPRRSSAAMAIRPEGADAPIIADMGSGALLRMAQAGIDFARVRSVFFTHLHPDHTGDLVPLLFAKRNPDESHHNVDLTLRGGPGFAAFVEALRGVYGSWIDGRETAAEGAYALRVEELAAGDVVELADPAGVRVRTAPVRHIESSLAYRFEDADGRSIVMSGDTDVSDDLVGLARGADLLLLECSFPDDAKVKGHLTPSECGEIAARAEVPALLLYHFYPGTDAEPHEELCRKAGYEGRVIPGADLLRVRVGKEGVQLFEEAVA